MLTLSKYKQLQGIPDTPGPLDTILKDCIASATQAIEEYCSRQFCFERRTVVTDSDGHWIMLSAYPVADLHSVTCGGEPLEGMVLDAERGMLYRAAGWPVGVRNITIDYTGGFSEKDMPINVIHAAAMLTKQIAGLLESGGQAAVSERLGDYQISYARNVVGGGNAGAGSEGGLAYYAPTVAALIRPYVARWI